MLKSVNGRVLNQFHQYLCKQETQYYVLVSNTI